ncbi:MAG: hypothetical protein WCI67_23070 [Chloroflexales bacterium]
MATTVQVEGDGMPEIRPGLEDRGLLQRHAEQAGVEAAALVGRLLALGDPVGRRDAGLPSPVAQQRGLADGFILPPYRRFA